jgi:hypothetical protein
MIAKAESFRTRAFMLDAEVEMRFRDPLLTANDYISDSNELFLIVLSPTNRRMEIAALRTRLRAKQVALANKQYLWAGDDVHSRAINLVNDMLALLDSV